MVENNKNNESKINNILKYVRNLILKSNYYSGKIETIDFIIDKLTDEQFEVYLRRSPN